MLSGTKTTTSKLVYRAAKAFAVLCLFGILDATALAQSITAPSSFKVEDNSVYNLVSGSGTSVSVSGSDPIVVYVYASSGLVKITTTSGLTAPSTHNSSQWTGNSSIAFSGSISDVNAALASLSVKGSSSTISIHALPSGGAYNFTNDHYYVLSTVSNIGWSAAKTAAEASSIRSSQGYLATLTSADEESFVTNHLNLATSGLYNGTWIGASDIANEGLWIWDSGPESGTQFWSGRTATSGGYAVSGLYSNWHWSQPSDTKATENGASIYFHPADLAWVWVDARVDGLNGQVGPYITEYSSSPVAFVVDLLTSHSISMSDIERELDDGSFTIADPSSASSGAFSYSISNSGVATISGNTVTPVGIGSATITATQAADSTYASTSTTFTLTVTENGTSVTSCSDAAARAAHYIATGNSGYCGGTLTKAAAYIYEIWLGDSSAGMTASCRIWIGTLPVMRHQYQAGEKAQGGPIDVKNCSDGTYDTIHLIKSRYLQFAGYASYPAPSGSASHGNTARSTTTFATSNADHAVLSDWLEDSTGFAASSRPYVRTTSSATSIYKKLAAQPSSSDLSGASDADMYFDEYKRLTASQNNTLSGWLCEGASSQTVCAQILSNDTTRLEWRYTNAASEVSGLPISLSNAKGCNLTIDLSYKSADTSNNQNTGINFLWRNNSGTVEMVGVKPDDGDINISLGKPKC
ncbi:lectin-like protein [Alphaproteobacteria bacterium LSUCC0719]